MSMGRYLRCIGQTIDSSVHGEVTTVNGSPIASVKIGNTTYTRVLDEISPVQLNYTVPTDIPQTITASTSTSETLQTNVSINLWGAMGNYSVVGNTGSITGDATLHRSNVSSQHPYGPLQITLSASGNGTHTGDIELNICSSGEAFVDGEFGNRSMYRTFSFPYNLNISYSPTPSIPSYPSPTPPVDTTTPNGNVSCIFVGIGEDNNWGGTPDSWVGDLESGLDFVGPGSEYGNVFQGGGSSGNGIFNSMSAALESTAESILNDNTPNDYIVILVGPLYNNGNPDEGSVAKSYIESLLNYNGNYLTPGNWNTFTIISIGGVADDVKEMQSTLEENNIWVLGLEIAPPIDAINTIMSMGTTSSMSGDHFPCIAENMPMATALGTLLQIARGEPHEMSDDLINVTFTSDYTDIPAILMPYGLVSHYNDYLEHDSIGRMQAGNSDSVIIYTENALEEYQQLPISNYYTTWNYADSVTNFEGKFYSPIKLWYNENIAFDYNLGILLNGGSFSVTSEYSYPLFIFNASTINTIDIDDNFENVASSISSVFSTSGGGGIFVDPYGLSKWHTFMDALDWKDIMSKSFCLYVNPNIVTILKMLTNKWHPNNPDSFNDNLLLKKKANYAYLYNHNGDGSACTPLEDNAWYIPFNYVQLCGYEEDTVVGDSAFNIIQEMLGFATNEGGKWNNIIELAVPTYMHQPGGNTVVMPYYVSKRFIPSLYGSSSSSGRSFFTSENCAGINEQ